MILWMRVVRNEMEGTFNKKVYYGKLVWADTIKTHFQPFWTAVRPISRPLEKDL